MNNSDLLSDAAAFAPGLLQERRLTWIDFGVALLALPGRLIWATVALICRLWRQVQILADAAPDEMRDATSAVMKEGEARVPRAREAIGELVLVLKTEPERSDVSGPDVGTVDTAVMEVVGGEIDTLPDQIEAVAPMTTAGKALGKVAGIATGMAFSYATTDALGQVARRYCAGGRTMNTAPLRDTFHNLPGPAKQMQIQCLPQTQQQAATLDASQVMAMVRGD